MSSLTKSNRYFERRSRDLWRAKMLFLENFNHILWEFKTSDTTGKDSYNFGQNLSVDPFLIWMSCPYRQKFRVHTEDKLWRTLGGRLVNLQPTLQNRGFLLANRELSDYLKLASLRFFGSDSRFVNIETREKLQNMVQNRRNSLAMAGLVDKDNAENLQVWNFMVFWKYRLSES